VDRCALFVDAGYVLSDGAMAVHGTRRRESVSWDYEGLLQLLASLARERSALPLLRCYWYEATVEGRRSPDHDALADLPGVKLRLAKMRPGRREGVETEIHRDLTTLARNKAISDALLVSAEEDLSQVIADVQDLGLRVTMAHITVDGNWTISRALRQECDDIVELTSAHLRPYVELISGAEPARADEQDGVLPIGLRSMANGHASSNGGSYKPLPAASGAHQAPPAIYTAPVVAEYTRSPQVSWPRPDDNAGAGHDEPQADEREAQPAPVSSLQEMYGAPVSAVPDEAQADPGPPQYQPAEPAPPQYQPPGLLPNQPPGLQPAGSFGQGSPGQGSFGQGPPGQQAGQQSAAGPGQLRRLPSRTSAGSAQPSQPSTPAASASPPAAPPLPAAPAPAGPPAPPAAAASASSYAASTPSFTASTPSFTAAPSAQAAPAPPAAAPAPAPSRVSVPAVAPQAQQQPPQAENFSPARNGPYSGPQPVASPNYSPSGPAPAAVSLADAVQAAHEEGQDFGASVARDAPALWLEAVLARKPRMPSDLEARLLQGSALPIDFLLHDEVRHALRRGFWDALERSRR
jgi:hypothetical protein